MKKLATLFLCMLICMPVFAKKEEFPDGKVPEYQVQAEAVPNGGYAMLRVSIFTAKKENATDDLFERAAIHAILFRGYTETQSQFGGKANTFKPLAGSAAAEAQHTDFFTPFFRDGLYKNYVHVVEDSRKVVKSGKQWKVSTVVSVNVNMLRKDLQDNGVLRDGLNSGW